VDRRLGFDYWDPAQVTMLADSPDGKGQTWRPEVQTDLQLTQDQLIEAQNAYNSLSKQIPGLDEFIAAQKEKNANLSEEELASQNFETMRGISRIMSDFYFQKLKTILTSRQNDRLDQLVLQVHGPVLIFVQTNLVSALQISPDQMKRIQEVISETDPEITPTLQKFGRGFISGYSPGETEESREHEMKELITSLHRLIKQRDERILQVLTEEQRRQFGNLQGTPLEIKWNPWEFLREPFSQSSITYSLQSKA